MARLVLASTNKGKLRELRQLLSGWPVELMSLADYPDAPPVVEDGDTFVKNAIKKAVSLARYSGEVALADDSGLEVDALGGRPGVLSARFAGEQGNDSANNRLLLELMADVPQENRGARFRCAIAIAGPEGTIDTAEGACEGRIGYEPRGEGGFGYDPLFFIPEYGCTMAELSEEVKNRLSHRAMAMQGAVKLLKPFLSKPD